MSYPTPDRFDAGGGVLVSCEFSDPPDLPGPPDQPGSRGVLVFGHGAGADMQHANMRALSEAFSAAGLVVMRFNFPFTEAGRRRVDSRAVSTACIAAATRYARERLPDRPMLLGGHSFGGRMASHAVLDEGLTGLAGLVFGSFPLHPAGKPATERADHLADIDLPMLFLSGTRDALAEAELMTRMVESLGERARLHWLDTADHGYKVLKRSRRAEQDVFEEMGEALGMFLDDLGLGTKTP